MIVCRFCGGWLTRLYPGKIPGWTCVGCGRFNAEEPHPDPVASPEEGE